MSATYSDRINGVETSVAIKAPVRVATTGAITLSGLQTIDSIALAVGDRVLVKDQVDATQNGIWLASASTWTRSIDFNGVRDAVTGTSVYVTDGVINSLDMFVLTTDSPVIGSTGLAFTPQFRNMVSPASFGAKGDGVTDDTQALKDWAESGGNLYAPPGTYLVAAAGADAGGVNATISESTTVSCAAGCVFKAGTGLDNDIFRINCDSSGYTSTRDIKFTWHGGMFDQTGQKNSTSLPFSTSYPPSNLGASGTAGALSIRGEVDDGGTPVAGFSVVRATGIDVLASSAGHWESAGGDSGVFVGGAKHIHVSASTFRGSRDLGVYASGLSSGSIPGGSCFIGWNEFHGCMFGASTKRLLSNVQMVNNIGYNTAVVCTSTDVTETGDNVLISNNIGHGAWKVVRATAGDGVLVQGNQSFKHGHLLQDGTVPTSIFNSNNACVHFEGAEKSKASGNHITGLNTGFTGETCAVRLSDDGSRDSADNFVHGNSAEGVASVVIEDSGEADGTLCWGNHGVNLTAEPVVLHGASSMNRMDNPVQKTQAFTSVGATLTVTNTPIDKDHVEVFFDSILQDPADYTLAANIITFTAGAPVGISKALVRYSHY